MLLERINTEKRRKILKPLAFGIHHKLSQLLQTFFEERLHHSSFFFYEFFLERPLTRWERKEDIFDEAQSVTAPFLSRIVHKTGFVPALNIDILETLTSVGQIQTVPVTEENLKKYWGDSDTMCFKVGEADILKRLIARWLDTDGHEKPPYMTKHSKIELQKNGIVTYLGGLATNYLRNKYAPRLLRKAKEKGISNQSALALLREYELVLKPWLRSHEVKEVAVISCSISSEAIFWGEFFVVAPFLGDEGTHVLPKWLSDLKELLAQEAKNTYLPMMTLLENYLYEEELEDKLKEVEARTGSLPKTLDGAFAFSGIDLSWIGRHSKCLEKVGAGFGVTEGPRAGEKMEIAPTGNVFLCLLKECVLRHDEEIWKKKLNKIERALVELWADRLAFIAHDPISVRESLIFAKYLIASPAMVGCTLKAISLRHASEDPIRGRRRSVKTALVVGGPGSGKDSMARLIQLFSPGYRFGRIKTLNMAMFRPKEAAVPMLLGLEAAYHSGKGDDVCDNQFCLDGVIKRHLSDCLHSEEVADPHHVDVGRRGFTFILDELNSLDMDTQGALLRLLENGELQALGAMTPSFDRLDILVVGVMNEDPQLIMKRRSMEKVLRDKQIFGGILGEVLYELFRSQRRLRDDLYYRLIRGGEIQLPELRERHEDIPILFYFIIKTELQSLIPESMRSKWEVELPVFEALIDPPLEWEGNLRELQTIARKVVARAVEDYEDRGSAEGIFKILGATTRRVLGEQRRGHIVGNTGIGAPGP